MTLPWGAVRKVFGWCRDAALILVIAIVLLLVLEQVYRAVVPPVLDPATRMDAEVDSSMHPYAREPWWNDFRRSSRAARRPRYDPYRTYWARAARTRYANTDSTGHRVTMQAPVPEQARQLWMLGGSTMWGFTARDSFTIPSLVARGLERRGVTDVRVVNMGQSGYNATEELITMELEMAHGGTPAMAVFLDGYNDVASALRFGAPGRTYWDEEIASKIAVASRGFTAQLLGLGSYSRMIRELRARLHVGPPPPDRAGFPPARICGAAADYFTRIAGEAEAVARGHGFRTFYVLQPVREASSKPFTPWEQYLAEKARLAEPWRLGVGPCMASLDSAMTRRAEGQPLYRSLVGMFDADTATIFVDDNAHITEAANQRVADRIVEVILPYLAARPGGPARGHR